jgi:hypothetical protein
MAQRQDFDSLFDGAMAMPAFAITEDDREPARNLYEMLTRAGHTFGQPSTLGASIRRSREMHREHPALGGWGPQSFARPPAGDEPPAADTLAAKLRAAGLSTRGVDDAEPDGLDGDARRIHRDIVGAMHEDPTRDYWRAFSATAPRADVEAFLTAPADTWFEGDAETSPTREDHQVAIAIARAHAVEYGDALALLQSARDLAELEADDGASDVPWLDARPRSEPPRPWSDDDWQVDSRRAAAHRIDLTREAWEAFAAEGRDYVGEQFADRREQTLARERQAHEARRDAARASELGRRGKALNAETLRRAHERVASRG